MPSFRPIFATALLAAIAPALLASPIWAQFEEPPEFKSATVGFGGKFKSGHWCPVRLALMAPKFGTTGRLELAAADGDQTPAIYADEDEEQLNIGPGEMKIVERYVKSGPIGSPIKARFQMDGRVVWEQDLGAPALGATQELVVGLGPSAGLEDVAAALKRRADGGLQVAQVAAAGELPHSWWGYDGVDTVLLATSDAQFLAAMTDAQRTALRQWVELGGRLVLTVGARGAEISALGSAWAEFVPGKLEEVVPLRERAGLETFTRSELPFEQEFFQRNRPMIARLSEVRGEVLFGEATVSSAKPLAVRTPFGLGQVLFVALDLDHPSLAAWPGRARLLAALVQRESQPTDTAEQETQQLGHLGYTDLIGQLHHALEQFPGVSLVNFTTVAVLTIVYLLLIGPGDYLLLSRLGWPRHFTWISFPLVAVAALVGVVLVGRQAHGTRVRLNQVEIVDIDLEHKVVRGTAWAHLYSPETARYDAELTLAAPSELATHPQGWLAYQGLPGDVLGGLGSRQVALLATEPYRATTPGLRQEVTGLPTPTASSKSLAIRWWAATPLVVENQLALDAFGQLGGEFQQPLAVELRDCLLASGEKLFRLGTLRPGQHVAVDPQRALNLEWRLTERRVQQTKDVATPWNQTATDVPPIVQMLMFHQAAGGRNYTGLTNNYQPQIDLSEHIRLGQAVLVGRAETPVAQLKHNGEPLAAPSETTTWTWYRLILPVKPQPPPAR